MTLLIQALLLQGDSRNLLEWPQQREMWAAGSGVLWVDVQAPAQPEMEALAADLGLSPNVVRACLHPEHRARVKEFKTHFLLVLNAVGRGTSENGGATEIARWRAQELNVVVGERFILTVHPANVSVINQLFQRYSREGEGRAQVESLFFAIADGVTSGYNLVLDRIDRQIDQLETAIFGGTTDAGIVDRLVGLKRHVLYLRRVLGPQRDALGALVRRDLPGLPPESRSYALDLYEQNLRLFDLLETYRDLISSALDAYRTSLSNRTNEVMKTLTIVSTIMLPLTLISGIFGMNFVRIPLAENPWGFGVVVLLMALLGALMTHYFKRRGWF